MSGAVCWRDAVHADRTLLQQFVCTSQVKRKRWDGLRSLPAAKLPELEAQGIARKLQPPAAGRQMMILGEDGKGIVAVGFSETVAGPHDVFVKLMAVALRARGRTPRMGDALLDEIVGRHMNLLVASDSEEPELIVTCKIAPDNEASMKLWQRNHAEIVDLDEVGGYYYWMVTFARPF